MYQRRGGRGRGAGYVHACARAWFLLRDAASAPCAASVLVSCRLSAGPARGGVGVVAGCLNKDTLNETRRITALKSTRKPP